MQPSQKSVRYLLADGFHDMAYTAWGEPDRTPVVCVHGLTRQGRDFDRLATALADDFYVICPDLPGRGLSDWLSGPALYQPLTYVTALGALLATLPPAVHWVGTSLGGICGMILAAQSKTPLTKLVLNDVGPFIPAAAIARIRDYMQPAPVLPDQAALETLLRVVHASFGVPDDAGWAEMAEYSGRSLPDGNVTLHYDPAIAEAFRAQEPADVDLRMFWEKIVIPTFTIRGALSDLLLEETLLEMEQAGSQSLTLPDVGHAPALMDGKTISAIRGFLAEN
ncbi:alpha/beta hydrolase [Acidisoma cellulosilytica]|uniref:Alpha/beta hydrolase n=1 Tax=Acidisoma cellulosilyticum TaxID=2802395 RepID=A0A963YY14_9PROT|nr:alpha/beta hydrolase [Acidisoma cellulosilyticum]MCB8878921.1 alpha/beta hydrolase [Acidisoma cellulosilyticum]